MSHPFTTRRRLAGLLAVLSLAALVLVGRWIHVDPLGYRASIDGAEAELRQGRTH